VAEKLTVPVAREWFVDARTPARRMQVTRHPDQALVVLSLWQGGHCTGTFRLRVGDSPALVHALVDGLAAAMPDEPAAAPRARWLARVRARFRARARGRNADVIRLFGRR
jgi:hypothetical protein